MASRVFVRRSIGAILIVVALVSQSFAGFFAQELIAEAAILAIFALSLDLLATCGLVSFGHAGLLGVGCYVFAGLTVLAGGSPNVALPVAVVTGAVVAFLVGLFAVRTTGAFFIMVTLAAAEMLYAWGFRSRMFNGADGMGGVPRLDLTAIGIELNNPGTFALTMIAICVVIWLLLELVVSSPFGRTLAAIRQNPNRVSALGGRVFLYRLAAFTASGAIAALGRRTQSATHQFHLARPGELVRLRRRADCGGDWRYRNAGWRPAWRGAAGPAQGYAVFDIRPLVSLPRCRSLPVLRC